MLVPACGARTGLEADLGDARGDSGALPDEFVDPRLPRGCQESNRPTVYVVSRERELFSFDPPTVSLRTVGPLRCDLSSNPNSMAVSRNGDAFVGYAGGALYRVSTRDARCRDTAFDIGQLQADRYGMGFAADPATGAETLFIAQLFGRDTNARGLEIINTRTFELMFVGAFDPPLQQVELTGTGDGRLFGFAMDPVGSRLVSIDKDTARVQDVRSLAIGGTAGMGYSFAVAFWGGDFYFFTSQDTNSTVTRYSPSDDSVETLGQVEANIVGAGVSTCAPL
jgi:hypothetical protein